MHELGSLRSLASSESDIFESRGIISYAGRGEKCGFLFDKRRGSILEVEKNDCEKVLSNLLTPVKNSKTR